MSASKLVKPSIEYKESFLKALHEFQEEGRYSFLKIEDVEKDFQQFVDDINSGERHLHKPYADWVEPVPETVLWFVKEDKYIGTLNIRHRLNWHLEKWGGHINFVICPSMRGHGFGKKILSKGMPFACHFGIDRALITLDPENISGKKVVEFCGGKFEDSLQATRQFPARDRYWLDCS